MSASYIQLYIDSKKSFEITVSTHQHHIKIFSEQRKRYRRQLLAPQFLTLSINVNCLQGGSQSLFVAHVFKMPRLIQIIFGTHKDRFVLNISVNLLSFISCAK